MTMNTKTFDISKKRSRKRGFGNERHPSSPPALTQKPSSKAPTSEITFPPPEQKLFKGGFQNGHSIQPFQAENPRTTGSHSDIVNISLHFFLKDV